MQKNEPSSFSLFFEVLGALEAIQAPYMIIGAFAGSMFGISRVTYDIDIVVDLREEHIQALADIFPLPRYYADPEQMRDSIRLGIMFNIIDTNYGSKADLVPLTMEPRYRYAFQRRVRQRFKESEDNVIEVWCARPEDVMVGKLMAWAEGKGWRHENDIFEMMVFQLLSNEFADFDVGYIDQQAQALGDEVAALWQAIKVAAEEEAADDAP